MLIKRFQYSLLSQSIHTSDIPIPSTSIKSIYFKLYTFYSNVMIIQLYHEFLFKNNLFSFVILLFLTCLQNGSNFCVMKFLNAKFVVY